MKHNRTLYLMCVPALLLLLAFAYLPMSGMYMAFTEFNPVDDISDPPLWVSEFLLFPERESVFLERGRGIR